MRLRTDEVLIKFIENMGISTVMVKSMSVHRSEFSSSYMLVRSDETLERGSYRTTHDAHQID